MLELWFRLLLAGWMTYGPLAFFWTRMVRRSVTWRAQTAAREVALTFDDGPDPLYTREVLQILEQHRAEATFFVVGNKAAANPELVQEIADRGHDIGNHTYWHKYGWLVWPWQAPKEIDDTNQVVFEAIGRMPVLHRPPWGVFNLASLMYARKIGMVPILWSLAPGDWSARIKAEQIVERVMGRVQSGEIILLHDGRGYPVTPREELLRALPLLLQRLKAAGYRCVPLRHWVPEAAVPAPELPKGGSLG